MCSNKSYIILDGEETGISILITLGQMHFVANTYIKNKEYNLNTVL